MPLAPPRRTLAALSVAALLHFSLAAPARAEVERLEVLRREPVAAGRPFGLAGAYEKLAGRVHFALDPGDPANARIVDLGRAPRDDDGRVRFAADFYLLRPAAPCRGNGALLLEVPNRGGKALVRYFGRGAPRTLDPTSAEDFGDGFLLRHGFTLAWVGWQGDVPEEDGLLRLDAVPVAGEPPPEGLVRADHVFAEAAAVLPLGDRGHRPYPVADREDPRNVLTVRESRLGARRTIPREEWRFTDDGRGIGLVPEAGTEGTPDEAAAAAGEPELEEPARQPGEGGAAEAEPEAPAAAAPGDGQAEAGKPESDEDEAGTTAAEVLPGGEDEAGEGGSGEAVPGEPVAGEPGDLQPMEPGEPVPGEPEARLFEPGKIYEAVYVSRQPAVVGVGLAAVRDFASWLRHGDDSPAAVERVLGMGISQSGRFLRHFLYQGFNLDPAGRPAFDGLLIHTAGAGRGSFNHRFAQPSRDAQPFSAFFYPTDLFPFTGGVQTDPETGARDGLFAVLEEAARRTDGALPKVFFTNTGYEYWGRAAALIHTRVDGEADFDPAPDERLYHLAGTQHFVGPFPPEPAGTRHPENPADFFPVLRALLLGLDDWVARGTEPPPSRLPTLAGATLVPAAELAFPALADVAVPRQPHQAYRVDYGPRFQDRGLVEKEPPEVGRPFPALVPQVDADGNELGGLKLPEIAVPLATYTPWNWRAPQTGAPGELADFRGSFLPFAAGPAERRRTGDPRLSVAERYPSREAYLGRYAEAALALVEERYLLAEDLPYLLERAQALWQLVAER